MSRRLIVWLALPVHGESLPISPDSQVGYIWTMLCFCFAGAAFNLLDWQDTLAMWASLEYYGFYLLLLPMLFCVPYILMLGVMPSHAKKGLQNADR